MFKNDFLIDNRMFKSDYSVMNGMEFLKRAKRYAKKAGHGYRFNPTHGKGSHGRLYVGGNFATVKRGEIPPSLFNAMLKQLKIKKEEF